MPNDDEPKTTDWSKYYSQANEIKGIGGENKIVNRVKEFTSVIPAAYSPALMTELARRFPPELIAEKIEELLNATHVTKGGQEIVDNRGREGGLKLLMAYMVGMPVQRQEVLQVNVDSLDDLERRASASPALKQAVMRIAERTGGIKVVQSDPPSKSS